jgi:hypothetical protein
MNGTEARCPVVVTVPASSYSTTSTPGSAVSCTLTSRHSSNRTGSAARPASASDKNAARPSTRRGLPGGANGISITASSASRDSTVLTSLLSHCCRMQAKTSRGPSPPPVRSFTAASRCPPG